MHSSNAQILFNVISHAVECSPPAIEGSSVDVDGGQLILDLSFHLRLSVDAL